MLSLLRLSSRSNFKYVENVLRDWMPRVDESCGILKEIRSFLSRSKSDLRGFLNNISYNQRFKE
jgi:hypothetical protein